VPVVSDVSLTVGKGEVVAVIGPNGAGKSTVLRAVVGILSALTGSIMVAGKRLDSLSPERRARQGVGYVPQTGDVFAPLTVDENLEMGGYQLPRGAVEARIAEVLDYFPALHRLRKRRAQYLSGGERKMLAIARALMTKPELLLLDEPTANLSPDLGERVLGESLPKLATSGVALLIVEQRAIAVLQASDWAYVLAGGRVATSGPSNQLLTSKTLGEVFLGETASTLADAIAK
jgi:ABC-type branched-subunit amino acid transport system ATPase component